MSFRRVYGKYNSHKVNGFDSQKEARRYEQLKKREDAGEITELNKQVTYELIPKQTKTIEQYSEKTGKRLKDKIVVLEKACTYTADFVYYENGELVVEDVKGFRTEVYKIKKKLMLWRHGIRIKEV